MAEGNDGSHQNENFMIDMDETDGETVSFADILQANSEWEETATAVLGGSDNEHCSYDQGYVKRQALYACLTCNDPKSPNFKPAGICLACTLKCHNGHNLVELYTKRNFRCDCGTSKFPDTRCTLQPLKDEVNEKNLYNHNFQGVYCTCHRPYPDPEEEDDEEDEMIQCVICEDWLHGRHIDNDEVDTENDIGEAEFICETCAKKNSFLSRYYNQLRLQVQDENQKVPVSNDVVSTPMVVDDKVASDENNQVLLNLDKDASVKPSSNAVKSGMGSEDSMSQDSGVLTDEGEVLSERRGTKRPHSPGPEDICLLQTVFLTQAEITGGTWWKKEWRMELCKCSSCLKTYQENNVSFLLDAEDPLEVYEAKGKEKGINIATLEQAAIESTMSHLDHVGKIEFLHGVNGLKEGLGELFKRIGETGRAINRRDIETFFEELQAKRRRTE